MQQSLADADRIPHFLWASSILGIFYAKERRMVEAAATVRALSGFASAYILPFVGDVASGSGNAFPGDILLPAARDDVEEEDRIRFAYSMYFGQRLFSQLSGLPLTYPYTDWGAAMLREAFSLFRGDKASITATEPWKLEVYIRALTADTAGRTRKFAHSVMETRGFSRKEEFNFIEAQIREQHEFFYPLYEPRGRQAIKAFDPFRPNIISAHFTPYGSGVILHSLWATRHPESRVKMFGCLQGFLGICAHVPKHLRPNAGLEVIHVMNSIRLIAREL
ncbi:hypothetical protein DL93DRAFT_2232963 [Clavulina sp. PMI_390]|nr:hypothetical protein DL93DRAFT_2232963 [Clavulina sp. PMI_390]